MRGPLFLLTLVLYAWSALEMHEWVRVPQVVAHVLEHHSSLGHHDPSGPGHQHEDLPAPAHDHNPFDEGCQNEFCACGHLALVADWPVLQLSLPTLSVELPRFFVKPDIAAFSGSKWNPPRA